MALRGNLNDFSLPDVFQLVTFSRKTGVLRIKRADEAEGSVWFRDGDVFFAQSNWHAAMIGERLVRAGRITPQALEKALEARASEGPDGRRLGAILIAEGFITEAVLEAFVQEQIQDTIFDLMRWEEGEFDFKAMPQLDEEDIGLSVSIENVIMEGSRRLEEWGRIKKKIPSTDVVFKMATAPGEGTFEISLKPIEWNLLLLVDGTRSVADMARDTSRTDFDVARVVYGLFSAGLLEFTTDDEVERLRAEKRERDAVVALARAARRAAEEAERDEAAQREAALEAKARERAEAESRLSAMQAEADAPAKQAATRVTRPAEEPNFFSPHVTGPSAEDAAVLEEMMDAVLTRPNSEPHEIADMIELNELRPDEEALSEPSAVQERVEAGDEAALTAVLELEALSEVADEIVPEPEPAQDGVAGSQVELTADSATQPAVGWPEAFPDEAMYTPDAVAMPGLPGLELPLLPVTSGDMLADLTPIEVPSDSIEQALAAVAEVATEGLETAQHRPHDTAEMVADPLDAVTGTDEVADESPTSDATSWGDVIPAVLPEAAERVALPASFQPAESTAEPPKDVSDPLTAVSLAEEPEQLLAEPYVEPEFSWEPAPAAEPAPAPEPEPEPAPAAEPAPVPVLAPEPAPAPEPLPAPEPEPTPEAVPVPEPELAPEPLPTPAPVLQPAAELAPASATEPVPPPSPISIPAVASPTAPNSSYERELMSLGLGELPPEIFEVAPITEARVARRKQPQADTPRVFNMDSLEGDSPSSAGTTRTEGDESMDLAALLESLDQSSDEFARLETPLDSEARSAVSGFDPAVVLDDHSSRPTEGVISTDSFMDEVDVIGLSGGMTDELSALTGADRPARPVVNVAGIPEAGAGVLRRDQSVDKDTVLRIIEGIKNL